MEIAQIFLSILTPLTIAIVGYFIQRTLALRQRSWRVQERIADKRVEIYEKIAGDLNRIYCYVLDIGGFKDDTPDAILSAKRNVDKQMFMYEAIWPEDTFKQYLNYMDSAFETFTGVGEDAKIRSFEIEKEIARKKKGQQWDDSWHERFTEERDPEHQDKYHRLIKLISRDLMHVSELKS